ncbi:hypothetical protein VMCG_00434 [Cytospora schulzeri]|uniref:Uncharacterized protein n=1 Tax=Cytospora schulzeri TaxID=448051 RepID=A0A423XA82_9PEZI|nr:hypothetical protein VMCG_00434 [Valsa malicola]
MPPIPIYSRSPINAARAAGTTPQTTEKPPQNAPPDSIPPTTTAAASGYPPAQPGASPFLPAPTGSVSQSQYSPIQPTPTQPLPGSQGPPPPQPGAFPVAPGGGPPQTATATATSTLPPPPKAGEQNAAPQQTPYPPQMHIPPPSGTSAPVQAAQRGTSTATTSGFAAAAPSPFEHPPGYQQNVHAGEMDRYQRARQDALEAEERSRSSSLVGGGDGAAGEGVWDSARKALMAAGEKLADAEHEVWKRINKG